MKFQVAVATPICGDPKMAYAHSLAKMGMFFTRNRIYPDAESQAIHLLEPKSGCVLSDNREMLVERALQIPEITHLLFIDADMGFEPHALFILARRRLPFVAANYSWKTEPREFVSQRRDGTGKIRTGSNSTGLEEALFTGLGLALIERKVLETVKSPRFPIEWDAEDGRYTTEDYPFCRKIWEAGFPVYVDHDASKLVWHVGSQAYRWEDVPADAE